MKLLRVINFNTDTVRIGRDLRTTLIEIETDHGSCTETDTISVDSREQIIIKKIMRESIVLGVTDAR
jgi:hypothetical protein